MTAVDDEHRTTAGDLLIIHPGALGDVVTMFVLMSELRKKFRRLTLVCQNSVGYLAMRFNLADQCIPHESRYWTSLFTDRPDPRLVQLLTGNQQIILFSVSRDLEYRVKSTASVPIVRIPPRPPPDLNEHVTRFAAKALLEKGLIEEIPSQRKAVCCRSKPVEPEPVKNSKETILLHPGAGSPRKRWPLGNFFEVADRIRSTGLVPEVIIGPAERDVLETKLPFGLRVHVLNEVDELLQVLQSAAGFIGNDSGVAHLAACLGLPTTVIFTISNVSRWQPNGPAVTTLSHHLACLPCFETQKENCRQPDCLTAVAPDDVIESFKRLVNM